MDNPDIPALRASIDALDDEIVALVNRRCEYVAQVGRIKRTTQTPSACYIRAGREAEMVRRMADAFRARAFPMQAAAQIWRIIISASLSIEAPLAVSAFASDAQSDIYWYTREYFGNFTPITKQQGSRRVLGDILDGKAAVGALPMPDASADGAWWHRMPDELRIFACVPFVITGNAGPAALLVARVSPEETGDDVSLFSLETDAEVSQSRLKMVFDRHGANVRWLSAETLPSGNRAHLIELKGFHDADYAVFGHLREQIGASLLAIAHLGAYACPLLF